MKKLYEVKVDFSVYVVEESGFKAENYVENNFHEVINGLYPEIVGLTAVPIANSRQVSFADLSSVPYGLEENEEVTIADFLDKNQNK